ncbi:pseudouridine synthase [Halalkalibacter urbisdiaboli]|uniref:pseudouridine synthase n=1 Tax=Halalkalibacter urbisdiaboli TaxID=1960589 RepID=UPI000B42F42B|nr:pseudouridine synthase [Halalkalibacter urbisdiaboli]
MRIQKYISETGYCSRRETERLLSAGRITINGQKAEHDSFVEETDTVLIDNKEIVRKNKDIYLLFNKPVGITCTAQPLVKDNIISFLNYPERIFPVGRLDKQSEGLILLTNDGDIVNKMMREEYHHEKEYIVTVDRPIPDVFLQEMAQGVPILNKMTKKCQVKRVNEDTFRIVLTQGLNRQIRRMTKYFDYRVVRLQRVRLMNLTLNGLALGEWRDVASEELVLLKKLLNNGVAP